MRGPACTVLYSLQERVQRTLRYLFLKIDEDGLLQIGKTLLAEVIFENMNRQGNAR